MEDRSDRQPPPPRHGSPLVDYLAYARERGASDLHFSSRVRSYIRRFGSLQALGTAVLSTEETYRIIFDFLDVNQRRRLEETHSLEFCGEVPGQGRFRGNIVGHRLGWDAAFRLIDRDIPTFDRLQLPPNLKAFTEYRQGLVLVTGPSNSGKTSTMAALIDSINTERSEHIITIEWPIEYVHAPKRCQVTQREVGTHTGSFAGALRVALRQDPAFAMPATATMM